MPFYLECNTLADFDTCIYHPFARGRQQRQATDHDYNAKWYQDNGCAKHAKCLSCPFPIESCPNWTRICGPELHVKRVKC